MRCSRRVTPFPSSRPVPEPASSDHDRRRVVAGHVRRDLLQGAEPVLSSPLRRGGRINGDHFQILVGRHLHEPVAQRRCRHAGNHPAKAATASATRRSIAGVFAPVVALGSKIEVLDHDGTSAMVHGKRQHIGNCSPNAAISRRCRQSVERERNRLRRTDRVSSRIEHCRLKMSVVQVDREHLFSAQLVEIVHPWLEFPRRIEIPAVLGRVEGDVVADRS